MVVIGPLAKVAQQNQVAATVALCLSFTFLWYDMVWYSNAMICYFYAILWDIQKWFDMICYRMVWYAMLCFAMRFE